MNTAAIIMAAGAGTRMKSEKPKVAHEILGKPLIRWVVDAAHAADLEEVAVVVGHKRDQVEPLLDDCKVVVQKNLNGTADAVNSCRETFEHFQGSLLILSGDSPLITPNTMQLLVEMREQNDAAAVVLSMRLKDPTGYGRIIRSGDGQLERIVEQKDANPEERSIIECNSGFYCFDAQFLFEALKQVDNKNAQNEFYLTDVIEICKRAGRSVLVCEATDYQECLGINSRAQLAEASKLAQQRINQAHMDAGVTMWDPTQTWIGPDVSLASDVELLPQTFLLGKTEIGTRCVVGPNTRLTDTIVAEACTLNETIAQDVRIDQGASCGPRAYLRPGVHVREGAKVGTHVELKNSTVGPASKVPHLSYIGDASIGSHVNIGAGSITCNYDGKHKSKTTIGDKAFIGCDTMMVAPVNIGEGSCVGAGSVIAKDVSPDALALTRPEQTEIEGWALRRREQFAQED